ncbi:winged helix-turn-helix domain-containing protein [Kitasatospora sp. NPDC058478]|uniref:helix-turn-helix domain-containing protein n=1 Tax=unclassified Kitasatospora TaxID=2633591 RepID=UPI003662F0A1
MMQDPHALCQIESSQIRDVDRISTLLGDIPTHDALPVRDASNLEFDHQYEYAGRQVTGPLAVAASGQWASTTSGRIVTDTYSWLQAVHWVDGSGLALTPKSGPKFGPTTVRVAQELTKLTEVRPGVEYLMRVLKLSERTVQYHLAHLRNAGLLAYVELGTRIARSENQPSGAFRTSHFALTIPQAFDQALGIRTTGEGPDRRMTGIAEVGRQTIARLGKLASKAVRRRKKTKISKRRCTPVVGGSLTPPADQSPSATRLEGNGPINTTKKSNRGPHRNRVSRRFQLAAELRRRVLWLGKSDPARLAWVLTDVADAGWTATEVEAWLSLLDQPDHVRRPSGLLAHRLGAATLLWPTKEHRARAAEAQRERSHRAAKARAAVADGFMTGPTSATGLAQLPSAARQVIATARRAKAQAVAFQTATTPAAQTNTTAAEADIAAFLGAAL